MESTFSVTKQQVAARPALVRAIDIVVDSVDLSSFDRRVTNVACQALTLYHALGRADVDDVSEMLSCTISDIVYQKVSRECLRGEALRDAIVDAIVDVSGMTIVHPQ